VETTAANQHDSLPMLALLDKASVKPGCRFHADKAYSSQVRWFGGKTLRYQGRAKAHAWHILLAIAYDLKRLPKLFVQSSIRQEKYAF